ncbi:unnamed protein product [Caenorhabditis bovis]|uniref:RNA polymerase II-associated protein 3 n=1 Tax=Caenorhabditis bovis TaxID=2654633 RepID=A0A8S1FAE8_9PELO|nr:unnamed protein product [Caenorhabditis bovis]
MALELKEMGNQAYREKRFNAAVKFYTESLEIQPDPLVFSNRAQAFLKLQLPVLAQMDCAAALKFDQNDVKVLYRLALSLKELGNYEKSLKVAEICAKLSPTAATTQLLADLRKNIKNHAKIIDLPVVSRADYLQDDSELEDVAITYEGMESSNAELMPELPKSKKLARKPPKSFADFAADFNYLLDEPIILAEYFLSIDEADYHRLFDDLIDDRMANEILKALARYVEQNPGNGAQIARKLLKLADVGRFDMIIMLFGAEEKQAISDICKHISPPDADLIFGKFLS